MHLAFDTSQLCNYLEKALSISKYLVMLIELVLVYILYVLLIYSIFTSQEIGTTMSPKFQFRISAKLL